MTSKHLFFKAMREDLRHRGWMVALSVLGSFLILPMIWLIFANNPHSFTYYQEWIDPYWYAAREFWRGGANILGGVFAIGGALVAGLAGFRFVFHKDQVDTWHSLPIKRDTLFWVYYVDGSLVWLLPLLVCTVLTAALSGGLVLRKESAEGAYEVVKLAAGSFAVWTVAFLLVYHLVLVAMMFSGNVLNTIVSMLIMGVGSASLYGLGVAMFQGYFDTFLYYGVGKNIGAIYASPLVSVVVLLVERGQGRRDYSAGINLAVALLLGVLAWLLYRFRPSELAEQGIRSKFFSTVLRLVTTAGAGVGGWLFFYMITDVSILWSIFGAVLAVVLVHGILDVVFQMDFRAFFAHRLQMAGTVAAVLLICFAFYGDWFGYDAYLPEKEQIAGVRVNVESLGNRYDNFWTGQMMSYQDADTAYAFLERMTESSDGGESVYVWVTLKNGRTYWRRYYINRENRDAVMPIVSSEAYLNNTYCLDERVAQDYEVTLQPSRGTWEYGKKKFARGELLELVRAYNQDVLEDPETVLLGEGRLLMMVNLSFVRADGYKVMAELSIYESMERTIKALRALGYEKIVTPPKAEEIASITLSVDNFGNYRTAEDIVEAARKKYCVYGPDNTEGESGQATEVEEQSVEMPGVEGQGAEMSEVEGQSAEMSGVEGQGAEMSGVEGQSAEMSEVEGQGVEMSEVIEQGVMLERLEDMVLHITEREEIEELLPLISFSNGYKRWGIFKRLFIVIDITDREGETVTAYIKTGDLPEKYIRRFGSLMQDRMD